MELTEFLLARIAEDEAVARAAKPGPWHWEGDRDDHHGSWRLVTPDPEPVYPPGPYDATADAAWADAIDRRTVADGTACDDTGAQVEIADADAEHIARHDPARVLAECEAKRRIVDEWLSRSTAGGWFHLACLALPYADHPDYQPEWKP